MANCHDAAHRPRPVGAGHSAAASSIVGRKACLGANRGGSWKGDGGEGGNKNGGSIHGASSCQRNPSPCARSKAADRVAGLTKSRRFVEALKIRMSPSAGAGIAAP